jgi:hypothetical protein
MVIGSALANLLSINQYLADGWIKRERRGEIPIFATSNDRNE